MLLFITCFAEGTDAEGTEFQSASSFA